LFYIIKYDIIKLTLILIWQNFFYSHLYFFIKNDMKHLKSTAIVLTVFLLLSGTAGAKSAIYDTVPAGGGRYSLVWSDEFNVQGHFDTSKWSFSERGSPAWKRFLVKDPAYAQVNGGLLQLKMDRKVFSADSAVYQSAGVESSGKFEITYGKVEVRARFNRGKGSWPAIWMMPANPAAYGDWPQSGEIDIMEHVNRENVIHQTIHNGQATDSDGGSSATHSRAYKSDDFNIYPIVWTASSIQFYVNEKMQYRYDEVLNAGSRQWPFDKPFYILLNQSGGAGWPGAIDNADLPFALEVDYVRVYRQQ